MEPISLYFHVPYCRNKCIYCDFYSGGAKIADWNALSRSFLNELKSRGKEWNGREVVSIYFGGGTPSLVPGSILEELFIKLREEIGEKSISGNCEITLEANPEDVNEENIEVWERCGINRVSLGVQTFNNAGLKMIRRSHTGEQALDALKLLKDNFKNISADLIFGLPGQSPADVERDLEILSKVRPAHISVYSLMYEEGTALAELYRLHKLTKVDDEVSEEMFGMISSYLNKAGYNRYETSNYSIPGYESHHNIGYWTGRPYIGIGPSAHSYDGGCQRKWNPADLKGYLKKWNTEEIEFKNNGMSEAEVNHRYNPIMDHLTPEELHEEWIMLRLRMKEGIDLKEYEERFGRKFLDDLLRKSRKWLYSGELELSSSHLSVTDKGLMISDSVIVDLI